MYNWNGCRYSKSRRLQHDCHSVQVDAHFLQVCNIMRVSIWLMSWRNYSWMCIDNEQLSLCDKRRIWQHNGLGPNHLVFVAFSQFLYAAYNSTTKQEVITIGKSYRCWILISLHWYEYKRSKNSTVKIFSYDKNYRKLTVQELLGYLLGNVTLIKSCDTHECFKLSSVNAYINYTAFVITYT